MGAEWRRLITTRAVMSDRDQGDDRGGAEDFRPSQHRRASVAAEHGDVAGLIAGARREGLVVLLALRLGRGGTRLLQRIGPTLGRQHGDEVGELLGLQRQKLVAGLCRLQARPWRSGWP